MKLRRRLDEQGRSDLGGAPDLLVMVTGKAPLTPDGFEADAGGSQGLVYLEAQEGGDGRVALHRARFEGIPAWSADADHVGLVSRDLFFEAYLELLGKGTTALLPQQTQWPRTAPRRRRRRSSGAVRRDRLPRRRRRERQADALLVRPRGAADCRARHSGTENHGHQRRPHLRGRAADAGTLPRVQAHRHRAGDERSHRRCDGRRAAAWPVSRQAGVPSDLHQHPHTPRQPMAIAAPSCGHRRRARRRGESSRCRSDGHGPPGGDCLVAARGGRSRRAGLLHPGHHAHRQRRHGDQRGGVGTADRARRARGQRAARRGRAPARPAQRAAGPGARRPSGGGRGSMRCTSSSCTATEPAMRGVRCRCSRRRLPGPTH